MQGHSRHSRLHHGLVRLSQEERRVLQEPVPQGGQENQGIVRVLHQNRLQRPTYQEKRGDLRPLPQTRQKTHPRQLLPHRNHPPNQITEIKQVLPRLEETIKGYQESKDKFFKAAGWEEVLSTKKEMTFDKNLTLRLDQILKSYDAEVTYMEEDLKNIEEREE